MTQAEFKANVEAGKHLVKAEWRSGLAETRSGNNAKGRWEMPVIVHNVEIDGKPYELQQLLEKGTPTDKMVLPFKKGDAVVCAMVMQDEGKGMWRISAVVEPLK